MKNIGNIAKVNTRNLKSRKGITLIALVITIIVLLILAGITIATLTGQNGLFARAKQSKFEYEVSAAKEKLELAITDLRIEKVSKGEDLQKEHLLELNSEDIQIGSIEAFPIEAICDKYKFEIDENFAVKYVGEVDGTLVTYTTEPEGYTNQDKIKISIKVVNSKGIQTIEKPNGEKIQAEGQTEIKFDYEVTANGTYTFKVIDNTNKEVIKNIVINKIDKLEPLDFTPTIENVTKTGFTVIANANDAEADGTNSKSGIQRYEYYIKEETEKDYTKHETNEGKYSITNLKPGTRYNVYVVAYDKANNSKNSEVILCETDVETKEIYIDSINGNDENGDGTKEKPYSTLEKIAQNGIIEPGIKYNINLNDGEYTIGNKFANLNCNQSINIYGKKEKTKIIANDIYSNYGGGNGNYEINFYRLVWRTTKVVTNAIMPKTDLNFYNVAFDINFDIASYSYFIAGGSEYEFVNCTLPKHVKNFLRTDMGIIRLTNCYGGYSSGYGTSDNTWNYKTNYITSTPKVDTPTYRITDDESKWKNVGTGTNPDGSQANLGVYGGKYSWEN